MISIGPKLGELLILPMTSIVTPPDFSVDDPARDRSAREDDSPQVPCLSPSRLRAQVHYGVTVVVGNHGAALKKSHRAQCGRPTASPCWVRMGGNIRCNYAIASAGPCNETRSLSLMRAIRANSGT